MNRREARKALVAANPVPIDKAAGEPLAATEQALIDSILHEDRDVTGRSRPLLRRSGDRVPRLAIGLGAAVVLALAAVFVLSNSDGAPKAGPQSAYAAPLVHLAESTPLVLIGKSRLAR